MAPRRFGELIRATFRSYRLDFLFLMTAALCVLVPFFILDAIFNVQATTAMQFDFAQFQHYAHMAQMGPIGKRPAFTAPSPVAWVLNLLNVLVVIPLLYGIIVHMVVRRHLSGASVSMPDAFSHASHRVWRAWPTLLLAYALVFFAVLAAAAIIGLVAAVLGAVSVAPQVIVVIVTLLVIAMCCVVIFIAVKLAFVTPVVFEEGRFATHAIRRSAWLTKGHMWRTIGFAVIINIIAAIARLAIGGILTAAVHRVFAVVIIIDAVQVLTLPFTLLGMSLLYLDLRVRSDAAA